jgi:hypothetical protein
MLGFLVTLDCRFKAVRILFCFLLTMATPLGVSLLGPGEGRWDYAAFLDVDFDYIWLFCHWRYQ